MYPLNPPQTEDKEFLEDPTLSNEQKSAQNPKVIAIVFLLIIFLIFAAKYILNNVKSKNKKKNSTDNLVFKKDLAKQYGVKTDTLLKWMRIQCPEEGGIDIICSPIKKIPKEVVHLYLGVPEVGKDYSKAALAKECCVSRNILNSRLKKVVWPDTFLMISKEEYKKLRVLPPHVFKMLKLTHDNYYPPLLAA